jgi:ATP-dependent Lon protease
MMKVLAAHRAGLRTIILPTRNIDDLDELPQDVRKDLTLVPVERIDEVLAAALREREPERPKKKRAKVLEPQIATA